MENAVTVPLQFAQLLHDKDPQATLDYVRSVIKPLSAAARSAQAQERNLTQLIQEYKARPEYKEAVRKYVQRIPQTSKELKANGQIIMRCMVLRKARAENHAMAKGLVRAFKELNRYLSYRYHGKFDASKGSLTMYFSHLFTALTSLDQLSGAAVISFYPADYYAGDSFEPSIKACINESLDKRMASFTALSASSSPMNANAWHQLAQDMLDVLIAHGKPQAHSKVQEFADRVKILSQSKVNP